MNTPFDNRLIQDVISSRAHVACLFFLCFTFSYIDRQVVAILVAPLQADLHLSDIQIGKQSEPVYRAAHRSPEPSSTGIG